MDYKLNIDLSKKDFFENDDLEESEKKIHYIETMKALTDFLNYIYEFHINIENNEYSYQDIVNFMNIIREISPDYIKRIEDSDLIDKTMSVLEKFLFHSINHPEKVNSDIEAVKNMLLFVKGLSENMSNEFLEQKEKILNYYYDTLIPEFLKNFGTSSTFADPDEIETFDKNLELSLDICESNSTPEETMELVIENNIIESIRQKILSGTDDYGVNILQVIEMIISDNTYSSAREKIIYNLLHLYFINELSYGKNKDSEEYSEDIDYLMEAFSTLDKKEYIKIVFGLYEEEKIIRPKLQTLAAFDRMLKPIMQSSLPLGFKNTFLSQIIEYIFNDKEKIDDLDTLNEMTNLFVHISSIVKNYNLTISSDTQNILTNFADFILDESIKNPENNLFNMQTHENKEEILDIILWMTKYTDSKLKNISLFKIIKSQILEEFIESDYIKIVKQSYEIISLCLLSINKYTEQLTETEEYNAIFTKLLLVLSREKNSIISNENKTECEERLLPVISEIIKNNIDDNGNVINSGDDLLKSLKALSYEIGEIQNPYDTEELDELFKAENSQPTHKKEDSDAMEEELFDGVKPVNPATTATKTLNGNAQITSSTKTTRLKSGNYIDNRVISITKDGKTYLLYNGGQQRIGKNRNIGDCEKGKLMLGKVGIDCSFNKSEENDDEIRLTGEISIPPQDCGYTVKLKCSVVIDKKCKSDQPITIDARNSELIIEKEDRTQIKRKINRFKLKISYKDNSMGYSLNFHPADKIFEKISANNTTEIYENYPLNGNINRKISETYYKNGSIIFNFFRPDGTICASFEDKFKQILYTTYNKEGEKVSRKTFLKDSEFDSETQSTRFVNTKNKNEVLFYKLPFTNCSSFKIMNELDSEIPLIEYSIKKSTKRICYSDKYKKIYYYLNEYSDENKVSIINDLANKCITINCYDEEENYIKTVEINIGLLNYLLNTGMIKNFPDDLYKEFPDKNGNNMSVLKGGDMDDIRNFLRSHIKKRFEENGLYGFNGGCLAEENLITFSRINSLEELYKTLFLATSFKSKTDINILKKLISDCETGVSRDGIFVIPYTIPGHAIIVLLKNEKGVLDYRIFDSSLSTLYKDNMYLFNDSLSPREKKEKYINHGVQSLGSCWFYSSVISAMLSKMNLEDFFNGTFDKDRLNEMVFNEIKSFTEEYNIEFLNNFVSIDEKSNSPFEFFKTTIGTTAVDSATLLNSIKMKYATESFDLYSKIIVRDYIVEHYDEVLNAQFEKFRGTNSSVQVDAVKEIMDKYIEALNKDIEDKNDELKIDFGEERMIDTIISSYAKEYFEENSCNASNKDQIAIFFLKKLLGVESLEEINSGNLKYKLMDAYKKFTKKEFKEEIEEDANSAESFEFTQDTFDIFTTHEEENKTYESDPEPQNAISQTPAISKDAAKIINSRKRLEGNSLEILNNIVLQKNQINPDNDLIYKTIDGRNCYNFVFTPLDNAMRNSSIKNLVEVFLQQKFNDDMINEITSGKDLRIFIPCNIGNHWVLEEALIRHEGNDGTTDKFGFYSSIYDSLNPNNSLNRGNLNCFEAFRTFFGTTIEERGEITNQDGRQVKPNLTLQTDSYSCGYFSSLFLEKRLNDENLSDIQTVDINRVIQDRVLELETLGMIENFKMNLDQLAAAQESRSRGYLSGNSRY